MADTGVIDVPVSTSARARRRWTVVILSVCLAAVATMAYWLTHPATVGEYGSGLRSHRAVSETLVADAGVWTRSGGDGAQSVTITVDSAELRIVENTARAEVELLLCRLVNGQGRIGSVAVDDSGTYCSSQLPLTDSVEYAPETTQLVIRISARQPGRVQIDGVDLTYRDGLRRGAAHTGVQTIVTFT